MRSNESICSLMPHISQNGFCTIAYLSVMVSLRPLVTPFMTVLALGVRTTWDTKRCPYVSDPLLRLEGTESASRDLWYWPKERASSDQATGKEPQEPWDCDRRPAPDTPSPRGTSGLPLEQTLPDRVGPQRWCVASEPASRDGGSVRRRSS